MWLTYVCVLVALACCTTILAEQQPHLVSDLKAVNNITYRLTACGGSSIEMECPTGFHLKIVKAFWGRNDSFTCMSPDDKNTGHYCFERKAKDLLAGLCDGERLCRAQATIGFFGDPCEERTSKYLLVDYRCQQTTYKALLCENSGRIPLACPPNKLIECQNAMFGRDDMNITCPHPVAMRTDNCSQPNALKIFRQFCDGRNTCEMEARLETLGDPCPGTYKFMRLAYTCAECRNDHPNDAECEYWATLGQCETNADWMIPNCRKACWKCDVGVPECTNIHANESECEEWTKKGDCLTNPAWMLAFCKKSCLQCDKPTTCENLYQAEGSSCDQWAEEGQCNDNPDFMLGNCRQSCFKCDDVIECSNNLGDNAKCEKWALDGECDKNPGFMLSQCLKACIGCTSPPVCENVHDDDTRCDFWANQGECMTNAVWMHKYCWRSCMRCESQPKCENNHTNFAECEYWARIGECNTNPTFMMKNCRMACSKCKSMRALEDCKDEHETSVCRQWAAEGQCHKNPDWMIPNCRRTCTLCQYERLRLEKIGGEVLPGDANAMTSTRSFILGEEFPVRAKLTHFAAFFANNHSVHLHVWRKTADGFRSIHTQRVQPQGRNYAQTVLVSGCVMVERGDRIGFSSSHSTSPIAYRFNPNMPYSPLHFRSSSETAREWDSINLPYVWSFSAGYDDQGTCSN